MGVFSPQISTRELVPVCRQLATSYDAGIPITRALVLTADNAKSRTAKAVLQNMAERIQNGATLDEAARSHQGHLPPFFIELLASGERGGKLDVMLRDLADYYEDRRKIQRSILGALVYPGLQLTAAWFLGTFAIGLISNLNLSAREPFNLMAYIRGYGVFQLQALVVLGILFLASIVLSRLGLVKWIWGWLATHVWPVSVVSQKFALARFFRGLSLLIGSGLHINRCIERAAAATNNPYIQRDLMRAVPFVAEGATLVDAFSGSRSLTPTAREMLAVGEESGELENSLKKVSEYHLEEANHFVQVALRVMNVLIVLAVGGLVGAIVITFYSRYLGMLNSLT